MKLHSLSFNDGGAIPGEFAFAVIAPGNHVALSSNRNPHLAWSDIPTGTRSFALICHDVDVPSRGDDVNREDREVPAELKRVDFFHWTLINLPAEVREIAAGSFSHGVSARGKAGPAVAGDPDGKLKQGLNDYTGWFAGDSEMGGDYYGYDGPCPPWNDSIVHRYVFTLYALDVAELDIAAPLTGPATWQALEGHVLAQAAITGHYTLNPRLAT